jgi:hypothetical protein
MMGSCIFFHISPLCASPLKTFDFMDPFRDEDVKELCELLMREKRNTGNSIHYFSYSIVFLASRQIASTWLSLKKPPRKLIVDFIKHK